jgi:hypothetical protein
MSTKADNILGAIKYFANIKKLPVEIFISIYDVVEETASANLN